MNYIDTCICKCMFTFTIEFCFKGGRGGSGGANDKRGSVMLGGDDLPTSLFGPDCDFIEDKFTALRAQAEKVANFEDRLERIVGMMKRITLGLKKVQKSADQVKSSKALSETKFLEAA